MKIYFCLGAIEFQCNFVLRPSKVRKLVRTNQFQVKSTKIDTVRKFVTLQYICYAGQTLHEGNSCTTGLCLGKASSHRRCITKHSRTGTRHNSDSKGNVSHGFPTCGPRQLRAWLWRKNSANFASNKAGESEDVVSRESWGAKTFWKHLGKVSFRVSRTSETGRPVSWPHFDVGNA